ncbi:MAG: Asp23/Gls24 family envelope stress response protein [Egibacteraceae bacterium]
MGEAVVSSVAVARIAAAAAREVPHVLALDGGARGEIATYGPQGPVRGVRVDRSATPRVRVRTVMRFGERLGEVAEEVRRRVREELAAQVPAFADAIVDVHVADVREDVREPDEDPTPSAPPGDPRPGPERS